jgi:ribonuclease HI
MPMNSPTSEPDNQGVRCAGRLRDLARSLLAAGSLPKFSPEQARQTAECLLLAADRLDPPAPNPGRVRPEPGAPRPDGPASAFLNTDGASRGNPGPAGAGAVLADADEKPIARLRRYLGHTTNNQAEYQALLMGLEEARARGIKNLTVRLDSELIVKQLNGAYRVKNPGLKPLYQQAKDLLKNFDQVQVTHVRRHLNSLADQLANEAIDKDG